jgi:hypothetical protein
MRINGKLAIGAALILAVIAAAGFGAGYRAHHEPEANFTWFHANDGRAGFAMLVNPNLWAWVTEHEGAGWTDTLLDERALERVTALVEHGMSSVPDACPAHWLMSDIRKLPDGSMFFEGRCATDAELRATRSDNVASPLP